MRKLILLAAVLLAVSCRGLTEQEKANYAKWRIQQNKLDSLDIELRIRQAEKMIRETE